MVGYTDGRLVGARQAKPGARVHLPTCAISHTTCQVISAPKHCAESRLVCVLDTFNHGSDAWNQLEYLDSLLEKGYALRFLLLFVGCRRAIIVSVPSVSLRKHSRISLEYARNNEQFPLKRKILPMLQLTRIAVINLKLTYLK